MEKPLMKIIERSGLTSDEIADFIGVFPEDVMDWCTGRAIPNARQVLDFSTITGRSMKEIYLAIIQTPFPPDVP